MRPLKCAYLSTPAGHTIKDANQILNAFKCSGSHETAICDIEEKVLCQVPQSSTSTMSEAGQPVQVHDKESH